MSLFGSREFNDDVISLDANNLMNPSTDGEGACARFYNRLINCLRESQEVDVLYDCRSRVMDYRECTNRHKQSVWAYRETLAGIRNEEKFKNWVRDYFQEFGNPPLLEAVEKVKRKVDPLGGPTILHPTHFKDPSPY